MANFTFQEKNYKIQRYPATTNKSLQPWNAADELLLQYWEENALEDTSPLILHDRFGFLATCLYKYKPTNVISYKSQEKAIKRNLEKNSLAPYARLYADILTPISTPTKMVLLNLPKTLDLFRLYLYQLSQCLTPDATVVCGFMTRHFTPQVLEIAAEYFESAEQTKAWKKARLLVLRNPKPYIAKEITHKIKLNEEKEFEQYYGVFSSGGIDIGSRFLMEHLTLKATDKRVLDLASGNGVLAWWLLQQKADLEMHLLDDDTLAIASSKINLQEASIHLHYNDCLDEFPDAYFDLVVSNPPFHFEYETNIEVSLKLFREVRRCLRPEGRFCLVANRHLNYMTQLIPLFKNVDIVAENEKFIIYNCYN